MVTPGYRLRFTRRDATNGIGSAHHSFGLSTVVIERLFSAQSTSIGLHFAINVEEMEMELFFDFLLLGAVLVVSAGIVIGVVRGQRKTK
jgi:hypothetical protein